MAIEEYEISGIARGASLIRDCDCVERRRAHPIMHKKRSSSKSRAALKLPHVFFELSAQDRRLGKIVMELRSDVVPKTAENFRKLCTGEFSRAYTYKGCIFHRIIPKFMCQSGDFINNNGTGGVSIYGSKFEDENFKLKHTRAGTLSMANNGPNTNNSQFFITFDKTPWLDGNHVVFGSVIKGMEIIEKIESFGTKDGMPTMQVVISNCGEIKR